MSSDKALWTHCTKQIESNEGLPSKTLSVAEIITAISQADPQELNKNYHVIVRTMQARMMNDQEPFV